MKRFICGLCRNRKKEFVTTREGLRKHLKEEHMILNEITNSGITDKTQSHWIIEEINVYGEKNEM